MSQEQETNAILHVLAIDDDFIQLELLKTIIDTMDYPKVKLQTAENIAAGMEIINKGQIDVVLTDYRLPDGTGLDVLNSIKTVNPLIEVVIMTAFQSAKDAVEVLKSGANDYLIKPTREREIKYLLTVIHDRMEYDREDIKTKKVIEKTFDSSMLIYKSRAMLELLRDASYSADSDATVLITGESGTGKELIARLIHEKSPRSKESFVAVNISALPETLVESELFGHKKGSFTGASEDRIGRFEEAAGGTIFIDEIGDISQILQVKLLRVLQFGEIQRVGENQARKLDVRIIAATNRDMEELVRKKEFRADFYYRLNVIPIRLPPLRDRKEDIPALVNHFVKKYAVKNNRNIESVSREAIDSIMRRPFPGNVRELENLVERAVVMCRGNTITVRDLPDQGSASVKSENGQDDNYELRMKHFETELLTSALAESDGNQSEAARVLGITERHLRSRMEKLAIVNSWRQD